MCFLSFQSDVSLSVHTTVSVCNQLRFQTLPMHDPATRLPDDSTKNIDRDQTLQMAPQWNSVHLADGAPEPKVDPDVITVYNMRYWKLKFKLICKDICVPQFNVHN